MCIRDRCPAYPCGSIATTVCRPEPDQHQCPATGGGGSANGLEGARLPGDCARSAHWCGDDAGPGPFNDRRSVPGGTGMAADIVPDVGEVRERASDRDNQIPLARSMFPRSHRSLGGMPLDALDVVRDYGATDAQIAQLSRAAMMSRARRR